MSEIAASGALADLAPLLSSLPAADDTLVVVEQLPTEWLADAARSQVLRLEPFQPAVAPPRPSRGRIFGAAFELRWEPLAAGGVLARYVGTPSELPGLSPLPWIDLSLMDDSVALDLWGKSVSPGHRSATALTSGLYSELRLPRLLRYPFPPPEPPRVQVSIRRYLRPGTGEVLFSRWLGLLSAKDGDR